MGDKIAEIETGELALAGGDRDRTAVAHLGDACLVIGGHRFLEPGEIAVAHQVRKPLGLGNGKGTMGIDHDIDLRSQMLTGRLDALG